MSRASKWILAASAVVLCISAGSADAETQPQTQAKPNHPKHSRRKAPAPPPLVLPPLSSSPLPQMPMDLLPAAPPKVGFQGGMLSIVAQNSTLGDILQDVRKLTGAAIDIPPNANERVVTRLGPGAPRDVLAQLLNGSSFNYVMIGSNSDPAAVASVVLTPKSGGGQPGAPGPATTQAYVPPQQQQQFVIQRNLPPPAAEPSGDENENSDEAAASGEENADQDQTEAEDSSQPEQPQQAQPGLQQQQQPGTPNAGPKTPEQILEMLRRSQQPPPGTPNTQQPPEN